MQPEIGAQCKNRWRSLLPMLGVNERFLTGKQSPCPICGGRDRFRWDNKEGRGTFFCNACGSGDGVKLAMSVNGWSFRDTAGRIRDIVGDAKAEKPKAVMSESQRRAMLKALWEQSAPILPEDGAGAYLTARGLPNPYPSDLRFVGACRVSGEAVSELPAMIALVRDASGKPCNIHRTYLSDGKKADISSPRKLMPGPVGVIRLSEVQPVLGIAEGIETALAVTRLFGVPCWSAISSSGMKQFRVPKGVDRLIIFGDNDPKYGGQEAAYSLAHKTACQPSPPAVEVRLPEQSGMDWADVLLHKQT